MTACRVQQNDKSTIFKNIPLEDAARNLACYNGKFIVPKGKLTLAIESGGWTIQSASFIVVDDQKANILGRNLLPKIGIKLIQEKPQNYQILPIEEGEKSNPEKKTMGHRQFHSIMHQKWESKKSCNENTIYSKCHAYPTKGSSYSDSSTRKSRNRTKQVIRPQTHCEIGPMLGQTVHQPDCNNRQERSNGKTRTSFEEN